MTPLNVALLTLGVVLGGALTLLALQVAWRREPPSVTPEQREQRRASYGEWARARIDGGQR